ncbi:TonB-dependent receptor plug domain-containing protein [Kineobactrum salinum]|uniref:TonB-dependent receptor plug domain-containing protein n=1 Tax=Kineobactrum salinum TaxID=2708301 RepID=A0A6C0U9V4_9GAMM|nr:TonB-dependent receptor plug domain-containing protein [Kineobactrum salinum]
MMKMLLTPIAYATLAMAGSSALAQQAGPVRENEAAATGARGTVEEVVVLGTRRTGRTDTQSVVPVDVIQPDAIGSTGYSDLNDSLRTLVPAFNVRRLPLNDGSSFVRPATLRSSPADHVLLLLNGKRRHRSATVQIGTGHATTSGSQGQDFNILPPIAFKSIQVLRDGASAQYGSDAIAGVINLSLRDASEGGSVSVEMGEYFDGGGETVDVQGNIGFALTDAGFLNLSAQVIDQSESVRVGTHLGVQGLLDMGIPNVPLEAGGTGDPAYKAVKTAWNAGLDLGGGRQAYLFGNYMKSESEVAFTYRQSLDAGGLGAHSTYADSQFDNSPAHPSTFDLTELYPAATSRSLAATRTISALSSVSARKRTSCSAGMPPSAGAGTRSSTVCGIPSMRPWEQSRPRASSPVRWPSASTSSAWSSSSRFLLMHLPVTCFSSVVSIIAMSSTPSPPVTATPTRRVRLLTCRLEPTASRVTAPTLLATSLPAAMLAI